MSDGTFETVVAGACDECGYPVEGVIVHVLPPSEERVVCPQCAPEGDPFGVHVRPRRDPPEGLHP